MKWEKHQILQRNSLLKAALPPTELLTHKSLTHWLNQYGVVMLKPSSGSGGVGIIKISSLGNERYQVHYGQLIQRFRKKSELANFIKARTRGRTYLIQRYIPLIQIENRPMDIRVMVQRNLQEMGSWHVTGKAVKIAGTGYVVTNVHRSKGTVLSLEEAFQRIQLEANFTMVEIHQHLDEIALQTAKQLQAYCPRTHSIGLDLAIDGDGRVWIIEANLRPMIGMFKHLPDQKIYEQIRHLRYQHESS